MILVSSKKSDYFEIRRGGDGYEGSHISIEMSYAKKVIKNKLYYER